MAGIIEREKRVSAEEVEPQYCARLTGHIAPMASSSNPLMRLYSLRKDTRAQLGTLEGVSCGAMIAGVLVGGTVGVATYGAGAGVAVLASSVALGYQRVKHNSSKATFIRELQRSQEGVLNGPDAENIYKAIKHSQKGRDQLIEALKDGLKKDSNFNAPSRKSKLNEVLTRFVDLYVPGQGDLARIGNLKGSNKQIFKNKVSLIVGEIAEKTDWQSFIGMTSSEMYKLRESVLSLNNSAQVRQKSLFSIEGADVYQHDLKGSRSVFPCNDKWREHVLNRNVDQSMEIV